jgi:hypothetical protein
VGNPAFSISGIGKGVSLSPDQKIEFQVWFHPTATGNASTTISFDSSAPLAPIKLAAVGSASSATISTPAATPSHSVTLDWTEHGDSAKGYHVYRSEMSGGPYSRINQGKLESTSFKDIDVEAGGHYFYVVTAVGEGGGHESAFSNEAAVEIPNN